MFMPLLLPTPISIIEQKNPQSMFQHKLAMKRYQAFVKAGKSSQKRQKHRQATPPIPEDKLVHEDLASLNNIVLLNGLIEENARCGLSRNVMRNKTPTNSSFALTNKKVESHLDFEAAVNVILSHVESDDVQEDTNHYVDMDDDEIRCLWGSDTRHSQPPKPPAVPRVSEAPFTPFFSMEIGQGVYCEPCNSIPQLLCPEVDSHGSNIKTTNTFFSASVCVPIGPKLGYARSGPRTYVSCAA